MILRGGELFAMLHYLSFLLRPCYRSVKIYSHFIHRQLLKIKDSKLKIQSWEKFQSFLLATARVEFSELSAHPGGYRIIRKISSLDTAARFAA